MTRRNSHDVSVVGLQVPVVDGVTVFNLHTPSNLYCVSRIVWSSLSPSLLLPFDISKRISGNHVCPGETNNAKPFIVEEQETHLGTRK